MFGSRNEDIYIPVISFNTSLEFRTSRTHINIVQLTRDKLSTLTLDRIVQPTFCCSAYSTFCTYYYNVPLFLFHIDMAKFLAFALFVASASAARHPKDIKNRQGIHHSSSILNSYLISLKLDMYSGDGQISSSIPYIVQFNKSFFDNMLKTAIHLTMDGMTIGTTCIRSNKRLGAS